jgi:hypothetical protein
VSCSASAVEELLLQPRSAVAARGLLSVKSILCKTKTMKTEHPKSRSRHYVLFDSNWPSATDSSCASSMFYLWLLDYEGGKGPYSSDDANDPLAFVEKQLQQSQAESLLTSDDLDHDYFTVWSCEKKNGVGGRLH